MSFNITSQNERVTVTYNHGLNDEVRDYRIIIRRFEDIFIVEFDFLFSYECWVEETYEYGSETCFDIDGVMSFIESHVSEVLSDELTDAENFEIRNLIGQL